MARLGYVDSARGMAVVLAMLSHSLYQFAPRLTGSEFVALGLMTRTATPAFLVLFGTMIEVAYLRKVRDGSSRRRVSERLLSRMMTCYLLYAAVVGASLAVGKIEPRMFFESLLWLGEDRFGTILRTYSGLFLIVALLLPLLVRYGSGVFLGLAAIAWVLKYALPPTGGLDGYAMNVVFGNGEGFGPAVLTSFTFVAFGVTLGEALTGRRGFARVLAFAGAAAVCLLVDLADKGPDGYAMLLKDYRWQNHPVYFAYGILTSGAIVALFRLLWLRTPPDPATMGLSIVGRQTLFVYGFGNVALNLLPVYHGSPKIGLALALLFLAGLFLLSLDRAWPRATLSNRLLLGVPGAFVSAYGRLVERVVQRVMRVFP